MKPFLDFNCTGSPKIQQMYSVDLLDMGSGSPSVFHQKLKSRSNRPSDFTPCLIVRGM